MSSQPQLASKVQRANQFLRQTRIVIYIVLIAFLAYYKWRYDLIRLPAGGSSPLREFDPGARLIVDVQSSVFAEGDAVFYSVDAGQWLLGRVQAPPPSAPQSVWEACRAGALWIQKDSAQGPGADSLVLGPIELVDVVGRVCGSLPW